MMNTPKTKLVARYDALSRSLPTYFTGKPCKHGHISERYTGNSTCVECARNRTVLWRIENREKFNEWSRNYYKDKRHWSRESSRRWKKENPEKAKANTRKWHRNNPDKVKPKIKAWRKANHERVLALNQKRRALEYGADGSYDEHDIKRIYESQRGMCPGCKRSLRKTKYHRDHIVPLSRGGSNWPENIQLLCPTCNNKKGSLLPDQWAKLL